MAGEPGGVHIIPGYNVISLRYELLSRPSPVLAEGETAPLAYLQRLKSYIVCIEQLVGFAVLPRIRVKCV